MRLSLVKLLSPAAIGLAAMSTLLPTSSRAQAYPIDCAILLCLSGGWPASEPCSRARAKFIERITPWPVEPPLQIWRCPMGASYPVDRQPHEAARFFDILFDHRSEPQRHSAPLIEPNLNTADSFASDFGRAPDAVVLPDLSPLPVQSRADIDISGPAFNFVRSIRVFDVRFAFQRENTEHDRCNRYAMVYLGSYGTQGEFSWAISAPSALPDAHAGMEGWGSFCPSIDHRSMFVEWRDYRGHYGFEQVNY